MTPLLEALTFAAAIAFFLLQVAVAIGFLWFGLRAFSHLLHTLF